MENKTKILSTSLLALILSLTAYSVTPRGNIHILFYLLFTSLILLLASNTLRSTNSEKEIQLYYILMSYITTILCLRIFVGAAGIGSPGSSGQIWFFQINQIWIEGIHIHHYYLGFITLPAIFLAKNKDLITPFRYRIGQAAILGIILDETGIILTGPPYYDPISYIGIILGLIGVFIYLKQKHSTQSQTGGNRWLGN